MKFNVTVTVAYGCIWGSDAYLKYAYSSSQGDGSISQYVSTIAPIEAEWCRGIWENSGSWLRPKWNLTGYDEWKPFSDMDRTERNTVWQAAIYKLEPKGDVIRELEKDLTDFLYTKSACIQQTNTSEGYQIRCVAE